MSSTFFVTVLQWILYTQFVFCFPRLQAFIKKDTEPEYTDIDNSYNTDYLPMAAMFQKRSKLPPDTTTSSKTGSESYSRFHEDQRENVAPLWLELLRQCRNKEHAKGRRAQTYNYLQTSASNARSITPQEYTLPLLLKRQMSFTDLIIDPVAETHNRLLLTQKRHSLTPPGRDWCRVVGSKFCPRVNGK